LLKYLIFLVSLSIFFLEEIISGGKAFPDKVIVDTIDIERKSDFSLLKGVTLHSLCITHLIDFPLSGLDEHPE